MTDNTMTDNVIDNMKNMKSKTTDMLREANRYRVLEDSDDE